MNYLKKRQLCLSMIISLTGVLNFVHINFTPTVIFKSCLSVPAPVDELINIKRFDSLYNCLVGKLQRKFNATLYTAVLTMRKTVEVQVEVESDENIALASIFDFQRLYKIFSLSFLFMKPFVGIASDEGLENKQPSSFSCLKKSMRNAVSCINSSCKYFPCHGLCQPLAVAHVANAAALVMEEGPGHCGCPCPSVISFAGSCCLGFSGGYVYGYTQDDPEITAFCENFLPSYNSDQTYVSLFGHHPELPVTAVGVHVGNMGGHCAGKFHDVAEKHGIVQACAMMKESCLQCLLQSCSVMKQSCLQCNTSTNSLDESEQIEENHTLADKSASCINRFFKGCPGWVQPLITSHVSNGTAVLLKCGPRLCGCPYPQMVSGVASASLGLITGCWARNQQNNSTTTAFYESCSIGLNSDTSCFDTNFFSVLNHTQQMPVTTIGINGGNVAGYCLAFAYDKINRYLYNAFMSSTQRGKAENSVLSKIDTTLLVQYLQHRQNKIREAQQKELMSRPVVGLIMDRDSNPTRESVVTSSLTPSPVTTNQEEQLSIENVKPVLARVDRNLLEQHLKTKIDLRSREEK